jgi:peptidyl-prolyl cis-trans isomerase SurA
VDRIVALVNGEIITLSELEQRGKFLYDDVRKTSTAGELEEKMKKARLQVLGHLIESRLLEEEMKKRKIEVPERDVDATIQDVLKSSNLTENDMKKALAREGMTYSTYRQNVRDQLGKMRLVSRKSSRRSSSRRGTEDYYQKNLEIHRSLEIKIQQIFSLCPRMPREKRRRGSKGSPGDSGKGPEGRFQRAGQEVFYGSRSQGWGLSYFKHRELMPELEEAGFKLRPGEVSDLIKPGRVPHFAGAGTEGRGTPPFAEVQLKIQEERASRGQEEIRGVDEGIKVEGVH